MEINQVSRKNGSQAVEPLLLSPAGELQTSNELENIDLSCLLCERLFPPPSEDTQQNASSISHKDELLKHLLDEHKFVISEVNLIADFKKYIETWKKRFKNNNLKDFCTVIKTNTSQNDIEPSEFYYLLCDLLPEDKELRERLQKERLASVIEHQQKEREDESFSKTCLFCKKHFTGNRTELYTHMKVDHSFNIGHPDNIVFGNELVDLLDGKLRSLQCLYCEKFFKTWDILKEHMRKKQHKRINPRNAAYDKFYLVNYLEMGKNWQTLQVDDDHSYQETEQENEDWNDWQEEGLGAVCLFCKFSSTDMDSLTNHMQNEHGFSLSDLKCKLNLNFYQQIKVINYIRKQVSLLRCVSCHKQFESSPDLVGHMTTEGHFMLIKKDDWDEPQYFFPTYENDTLLYLLEDGMEDNGIVDGATVIPEDINPITDTYLMDENVRQELKA